jgi:hypothetical protein
MKTWIPIAVGSTGRLRCRWESDVREYMGRMRILKWTEKTMGRVAQKRIFEQAETHK